MRLSAALAGVENKVLLLAKRGTAAVSVMRARDPDEMVFIDPSRNTDQGVQHMCEYLGGKPWCGMKVKASLWR